MKKKIGKLIALCMSVVFLLAAAVLPVSAADLSEEDKEALLASTESFIETIFTVGEDELAVIETYGDFYAIAAQAVRDNEKDLGEFVSITDGQISQSGDTVTMLIDVECTGYNAQIEMTYDAKNGMPKNLVINPDYPLSVNLANAGRNTVIGLVIVFVVLIFLAFVISLLKYVNRGARKKKKKENTEENAPLPIRDDVPETAAAETAVPAPAAAVSTANDEELIAVMAAAIACASEEGAPDSSYIVRSIRKVGSSKRWTRCL